MVHFEIRVGRHVRNPAAAIIMRLSWLVLTILITVKEFFIKGYQHPLILFFHQVNLQSCFISIGIQSKFLSLLFFSPYSTVKPLSSRCLRFKVLLPKVHLATIACSPQVLRLGSAHYAWVPWTLVMLGKSVNAICIIWDLLTSTGSHLWENVIRRLPKAFLTTSTSREATSLTRM